MKRKKSVLRTTISILSIFLLLSLVSCVSNNKLAEGKFTYSVCAGLDVNAKMQALKKGGKTLDGLYAVGTDSMGVLFTNKKGYANYGGVALGYAYTSGKIAGEEIAAALKK